jgi:hypothetical protein
MPGDVGLVAKAVDTIMSWVLDEQGMGEWRKRREGDKLEAAFRAAYREWRRAPTAENRRKRDEALATLRRWADAA